jgi:hypothetical protein
MRRAVRGGFPSPRSTTRASSAAVIARSLAIRADRSAASASHGAVAAVLSTAERMAVPPGIDPSVEVA